MPNEIKDRSPQEEAALKRLYNSTYPSSEHQAAEAEFNKERERRMRADGFTGEYKPQRDVRHEFEFIEKRDAQGRLTETTARSKEPLHRPEEVINWRDTQAGLKADEKARSKYHGSGDDAGHLISPEFGADPGNPRNLSKQNFVANEVGTFKKFENDSKAAVANQNAPHELEVRVRYKPDGTGEREITRNMTLYQRDQSGERQVAKELDFANTKTRAVRAKQGGGSADRAPDWEHNRGVQSALAHPDTPAHQEEWAKFKRLKSGDLTPEERLQMREELRERGLDGGLSKKKQH